MTDRAKTQKSRVSVIIPCFNGEMFLREAVESALAQTYPNTEVVVVNDGSTDGSLKILQDYGDRIRVVCQRNMGLSVARNTGIENSTGSLLAFLDADDYWTPLFLEKMIAALERDNADIAYCGWQNVGVRGGAGEPFVPPDYELFEDKTDILFINARWPVHAAVTRREIIEDVNGFDPRWSRCEDYALWLEIALQCRLSRVAEVMAFYRHHEGEQLTKTRWMMADTHWRIQRFYLMRHPEFIKRRGIRKIRKMTHGELLKRGYRCYWDRDIACARAIFRRVMRYGYGWPRDWLYMLPSLLPLKWHEWLLSTKDERFREH